MTSADSRSVDQSFLANSMASFLQISAVALLIFICYRILSPFLTMVVWSIIIAVAIYPAHLSMTARLGGREKLSATLFVLLGLAIIIIPTWALAESSIDGLKFIATELGDGAVTIPPPDASVADWPLVGDRVFEIWSQAAVNFEATLNQFQPQLQAASQWVIRFAGHAAGTVFQFIFSVIIAGVFLTIAAGGYSVSKDIATSLMGNNRGEEMTNLTIQTIRSVFKGVLGVALIQAALSAIGLLAIGVPGAGLWAGAVLVLAIIQLPPLLILGPIAFWVFSVSEPVPATIFAIYALIVSGSDTFLKPMLLGRGVKVPMLVILLGAIGGAFTMGILGLFIGSVILALGYEIFTAWMAPDEEPEATADA